MAAEAWAKVAHVLQQADDILQSKHSLIPEQQWEITAQELLGLSLDQVRFTVALFLTLPIGLGMRLIPSPLCKPRSSTRTPATLALQASQLNELS
jgi:hypothetical protein